MADMVRRAAPDVPEDNVSNQVYSSRAVLYREEGKKQVSRLAGKIRGFNCQLVLAANVPAHFPSVLAQAA